VKDFLTFILFVLFFFSSQLAVFSYFTNSTLKTKVVKEKLASIELYSVASKSIQNLQFGPDLTTQEREMLNTLKKEVTPDYIKSKMENIVDQAISWLEGKTSAPPEVDLTDLKTKINNDFPNRSLPEDLSKILDKPLKLKVIPQIESAKDYFQMVRNSFYVLFLLSLFSIIGIFLLGKNKKSGFQKISLALFLPAVFGIFLSSAVIFGTNLVFNLVLGALKDSPFRDFSKPLNSLFNSLAGTLSIQLLTTFAFGLILAFLIFIVSVFIKNKRNNSLVEDRGK